jgi:tetratricopeptide (TPR) repeat protein
LYVATQRRSPETIDRDLYLTLTQSYIKSGQLELALPHLDSLLRNHPQDKWGYLAKAGCLYQLRRFEDSIAACDVGYSVGADLPPAATLDANENLLITKGLCYNSLGRYELSIY